MLIIGGQGSNMSHGREVTGLKTKSGNLPEAKLTSYGTIDCGLETMCEAWTNLNHVFSSGGVEPTCKLCLTGGRLPWGLLNDHPVDILVTEHGHLHCPQKGPASDPRSKWEQLVYKALEANKPRVVI